MSSAWESSLAKMRVLAPRYAQEMRPAIPCRGTVASRFESGCDQLRCRRLVTDRVPRSPVNIGQVDTGPRPGTEKPVEKPLCEPKIGVDAARAEKAQCFGRIVLGEGDSCAHVISADLGRAQIVHQRQDRGKASGMLGQLVCQSAHRLQSTIWRDSPLDMIGECDPYAAGLCKEWKAPRFEFVCLASREGQGSFQNVQQASTISLQR